MTRNSIFVSGDCSLCWELRSLGAIVLGICHPSFEDKTISKFPDYIYQYTFTKKTMTDEHIPNILQSFLPTPCNKLFSNTRGISNTLTCLDNTNCALSTSFLNTLNSLIFK